MPNSRSPFMDLFVDREGSHSLSRQIYTQLRNAIEDGRLLPGDRLIASRELAAQLGVSRQTVSLAYGQLVDEGYIEGRTGAGSIVTGHAAKPAASSVRQGPLLPTDPFRGLAAAASTLPAIQFDLRAGFPDAAAFPLVAWRRALASTWDGPSPDGDPRGEPGLRQAISAWIRRTRAIDTAPDSVFVTAGTQHAVDLVARLLIKPGDTVVVENPGYLPIVTLFRLAGARVVGVPVDEQGMRVDCLPSEARLVYVTPSHQFPLGVTLTLPRRRILLQWAVDHGAAILEDDYDSEFRHTGRPLEPLYRLDRDGRVVYLGSFSKTLAPSIRLGFAVLPGSLIQPMTVLRQYSDGHPPFATQSALTNLMQLGVFGQHLRRTRRLYAHRYHLVMEELMGASARARGLTPIPSNAGLHVTATLPPSVNEARLLGALTATGIAVTGLKQYYHDGEGRPGLVLGFGRLPTDRIPLAFERLWQIMSSH